MAYWKAPPAFHTNVVNALAAVAEQFVVTDEIQAANAGYLNIFKRTETGPANMPEYGGDDYYGLEVGDAFVVRHDPDTPATVPAMAAAVGLSVFKVTNETEELIMLKYLGVSATPENAAAEEAKGIAAFGILGSEFSIHPTPPFTLTWACLGGRYGR